MTRRSFEATERPEHYDWARIADDDVAVVLDRVASSAVNWLEKKPGGWDRTAFMDHEDLLQEARIIAADTRRLDVREALYEPAAAHFLPHRVLSDVKDRFKRRVEASAGVRTHDVLSLDEWREEQPDADLEYFVEWDFVKICEGRARSLADFALVPLSDSLMGRVA